MKITDEEARNKTKLNGTTLRRYLSTVMTRDAIVTTIEMKGHS